MTMNQGFSSIKYADTFYRNIPNKKLRLDEFIIYNEPKFSYTQIPLIDNVCLNGYFQSEKYFIKHKKEILKLFHINDSTKKEVEDFIIKIKIGKPLTVVHVRRGDYLSKKEFHNPCSKEYYEECISKLPDNNFIFVSDDIDWCKNNFVGENIFYSDFNSEINDLILIMMSDNIIMSNSSFSWWGTWMNESKGKIVFCPKNWFGPIGPQDTDDIYIDGWIKV
jgi:hypothetical protein